MKRYFVTGSDTGVGKTTTTVNFLKLLRLNGLITAALKPIASGCELNEEGELRNEDALHLQNAMSMKFPYHCINPIAFQKPIAPLLAANELGVSMSLRRLMTLCEPILSCSADRLFIEGVGGFLQPLNATETLADFARQCQTSVILVVGMRLGCINHALLTYNQIKIKNLDLAGWVANCIDPDMLYCQENIQLLQQLIDAPLIATVPYNQFDFTVKTIDL